MKLLHAPCGAVLLRKSTTFSCNKHPLKFREILTEPHPLLHQEAKHITKIGEDICILAQDMMYTMHQAHGIGLAAPQIGVLARIFVMEIPKKYWKFSSEIKSSIGSSCTQNRNETEHKNICTPCSPSCVCFLSERRCFVCINPEIVYHSHQLGSMDEGCLSVPDDIVNVERPKFACLRWQSIDGKTYTRYFFNLEATCVQHEIDHLNGITILQKIH